MGTCHLFVQESVQFLTAHSKAEQVAALKARGRAQGLVALSPATGRAHVPALQEDLGEQVPVVVGLRFSAKSSMNRQAECSFLHLAFLKAALTLPGVSANSVRCSSP